MARQCERPGCAVRAAVAYGFDAARRSAWFADLVSAGDQATTGALCAAHAEAMVLPRGWWLDDRRDTGDGLLFGAGPETIRSPSAGGVAPAGREPRRRVAPTRARGGHRSEVTWQEVQLPLALHDERGGPTGGAEPVAGAPDSAGPGSAGPGSAGPGSAGPGPAGPGQADTDDVGPDRAADRDEVGSGALGAGDGLADQSAEPGQDAVVVPWRPRFDQADDLGGVLAARSPLLARAFGGLRRSAPPPPERE